MALVATTLASAKARNDIRATLTSATGIANKMLALVDSAEWLRITDVSLAPTVGFVPGYSGSTAGAHGILAPVVYGRTDEFEASGIVPGTIPTAQSFGIDGAITGPAGTGVPVSNTLIYLTKATAGAYTLAGPTKDATNTLTIVSTTAAAHTVTYTAGFAGNTTSSDVATFAATINGVLVIRAQNGTWAAVSLSGVTIA